MTPMIGLTDRPREMGNTGQRAPFELWFIALCLGFARDRVYHMSLMPAFHELS